MITVKLFGGLTKFFGNEIRLDIKCPGEVFWALANQCETFMQYIQSAAQCGVGYRIVVDDDEITGDKLGLPVIKRMSIAPAVGGSGAVGRILIGAALIVGSFFMPAAILGISSGTIGAIGASLIYGGIVQLLTPESKAQGDQNSFILDGGGRVKNYQGEAKPLLIGRWWIENAPIISFWMENENIPVNFEVT